MNGQEDDVKDHNLKTCMSRQAMQSMYDMMVNNKLCDAKIRLDDGTAFNIHRPILCSCSNYFRALFTNTLNGERNDVYIPGIRGPIMEKIINYAYMRICDVEEVNVYELLTIADYVGMIGLVRQCVDFIIKIMKPENCVGIMLFARGKFCRDLHDKAHSYILKNFLEVAVKSQEILKIDLRELYDIISDDMLNSRDEEPVWECCLRWINYDPSNRAQYVTTLMRGVRLGLLNTRFFMERVKDHPYVANSESAKPIIIETLTFLYDLDMIATRGDEIRTPALALPRLPHEVIFAIGGWSEGRPQSVIETYDTRADRWIRIHAEDPAGARAYHGTAVIGMKIYCIGGFDGVDYYNTCRVFDAVKKTWKEVAPMHCRRCYVSVTELNGYVYAMGGYDGQNRQNTAERYDPKTNQWTMISPMSVLRSDASACTLNGKIYVTGGFNGQECMNSVEMYDPTTNSWYPVPNMLSRRSGVSCVAYKGSIYVIGGFNGLSRMNTGEKFDPETQMWSSIQEMCHPRSNFGLEIIDDMIFAIGGFNGVHTIKHAECYEAESNEWLEATDMGIVRSALSANVIAGLPNVRDYTHQDRHTLIEERRQRMYAIESANDDNDQRQSLQLALPPINNDENRNPNVVNNNNNNDPNNNIGPNPNGNRHNSLIVLRPALNHRSIGVGRMRRSH